MEVNPDELVKLAAQSEAAAAVLAQQWAQAQASLAVARESLGDSPAAEAVAGTYETATAAADEVVRSLSQVLLDGVQALQQAAHDVRDADDRATQAFLAVRGLEDGPARGRRGEGHGHGAGHGAGQGAGQGAGHGHGGRGRG